MSEYARKSFQSQLLVQSSVICLQHPGAHRDRQHVTWKQHPSSDFYNWVKTVLRRKYPRFNEMVFILFAHPVSAN
jgi:hypothetical protein